jgi:hypothetical protein
MALEWDLHLDGEEGMWVTLAIARKCGHTRLFAISSNRSDPVQWHSVGGENAMQSFFDNCEDSDDFEQNCWTPVLVVNPQDTDEIINAVIASHQVRQGRGMGYFR